MRTPEQEARIDERRGNCYALAAQELLDRTSYGSDADAVNDVRLVHGEIGPDNNPHAWIEYTEVIEFGDITLRERWAWEPISEDVLPVDAHNAIYHVANPISYTMREAQRAILATKNYYFTADDTRKGDQ